METLSRLGMRVLREIGGRAEAGRKVRLLALDPGLSVEGALPLLRSLPWVEYAEPNYLRRALYTPDDPLFGQQWGFHNTGQVIGGTAGTPDADVDAVEAWDLERGLVHRPVVAVIDTGLDLGHPDLDGNLWVNVDEVPGNGLDDDGNGYVDDRNGYNMAGISHLYQNNWAYRLGNDQDHQLFAQSITGTGDYLSAVGVSVRRIGDPARPFTVSVRDSLSGPDLASAVVQPSEVSPFTGTLVEKTLSARVRLEAGSTYYLVFSTTQLDSSNYYLLYMNYKDPENPEEWRDIYRDGSGWRYFNSTSRWERGDFDFCFRTNSNPIPRDDNGHGTHCAGIAGAETGNATGVAGACPGARIMVLKAADSSGMFDSADWIEALRYAVDNGAEVVSLSFGGTVYSSAEQDAVNYAWSRGAVLCAAAGNTGDSTIIYPAGYEHVLGVGATDNRDQVAEFSTYNSSVDLSAPGVYVMSTVPTYPVAFTSYGIPLDYAYGFGTSMATPMAAGAAALVRSRNPSLEADRVVDALETGAEDRGDPGRDDYYGWGRLNARQALQAAGLPPVVESVLPGSGKVGAEVAVIGSGFGDSQGGSYVTFGTQRVAEYTSWSDGEIRCIVPPVSPGETPVKVTTSSGTSEPLPFTVLPFEVLVRVSGEGGSASPTRQEVAYGGTAVLTITPYPGYRIASITDNGRTVAVTDPAGMEYRIEEVREDHLVTVTFAVAVYTVTWYLAEGCTAAGMQTYILIQNPNPGAVTVDLTFMTGNGPVPGPRGFTLPANSRATFLANAYVPGEADLSTRVTSEGGGVVCERAMYGPGMAWAHDSVGVTSPSTTWYLAEGCTAAGMQTYILVQNPNPGAVTVDLTFMTGNGPVPGPRGFTLPANSRATFLANAYVPGEADLSTRVTSEGGGVVCERA
ncbi:MAG: S8 family serine peptidase, partial [Actinobacteria bacterium]|nr:S8 family serine peptidase [Actinomycetota bacterium]